MTTSIISPSAKFYTTRFVIGEHCRIDDGVILTGDIEIGDYVHIGAYCVFTGANGIKIGDYTGISPFTTIFTATDDFMGNGMVGPTVPEKYRTVRKGGVTIGRNCIIGCRTTILPWVNIRDGSGIGAHSLVKTDCAENTLYAGSPAVKVRDKSMIVWDLTKRFEIERALSTGTLHKREAE